MMKGPQKTDRGKLSIDPACASSNSVWPVPFVHFADQPASTSRTTPLSIPMHPRGALSLRR
jgi:hypothetical protein